MNYVQAVEVVDSEDQLLEDGAGLSLWQFLAVDDVFEQLAALCVLHDQEELFGTFDDFVELDEVRMPDDLEYVDLSGDPLDVCDLDDLVLVEDLDGH